MNKLTLFGLMFLLVAFISSSSAYATNDIYFAGTETSNPAGIYNVTNGTLANATTSANIIWTNTSVLTNTAYFITNYSYNNYTMTAEINNYTIDATKAELFGIFSNNNIDTTQEQLDNKTKIQFSFGGNFFGIYYVNTTGTQYYCLNNSSQWSAPASGNPNGSFVVPTPFNISIIRNNTAYNISVYNATGLIVNCTIALTSVNQTTGSDYIAWGDMSPQYWYGKMGVQYFNLTNMTTELPTVSLSVSLNEPSNLSTITNTTINFNATTTWTNDTVYNCSLWLNSTGIWALNKTNTSAIANATKFTISQILNDGAYLWNVGCYNSTSQIFDSSNRTINVNTAGSFAMGAVTTSSPVNETYPIWINASIINGTSLSKCMLQINRQYQGGYVLEPNITMSYDSANSRCYYYFPYTYTNGTYNATIFANDTSNTWKTNSTNFTVAYYLRGYGYWATLHGYPVDFEATDMWNAWNNVTWDVNGTNATYLNIPFNGKSIADLPVKYWVNSWSSSNANILMWSWGMRAFAFPIENPSGCPTCNYTNYSQTYPIHTGDDGRNGIGAIYYPGGAFLNTSFFSNLIGGIHERGGNIWIDVGHVPEQVSASNPSWIGSGSCSPGEHPTNASSNFYKNLSQYFMGKYNFTTGDAFILDYQTQDWMNVLQYGFKPSMQAQENANGTLLRYGMDSTSDGTGCSPAMSMSDVVSTWDRNHSISVPYAYGSSILSGFNTYADNSYMGLTGCLISIANISAGWGCDAACIDSSVQQAIQAGCPYIVGFDWYHASDDRILAFKTAIQKYTNYSVWMNPQVNGTETISLINVTSGNNSFNLPVSQQINITEPSNWTTKATPTLNGTINTTRWKNSGWIQARNSSGSVLSNDPHYTNNNSNLFYITNIMNPGDIYTSTLYWNVTNAVNVTEIRTVSNSTYNITNISISTNLSALATDVHPSIGLWFLLKNPYPQSVIVYNSTGGDITSICTFNSTHAYIPVGTLSMKSYTIQEQATGNAPTYSNIVTSNPTNYSDTQKTWMNITWTASYGISYVAIESNYSGSPTNYTPSNSSGVYYLNLVLPIGDYYWKSYANDTMDNWTTSTTQTFKIYKGYVPLSLSINQPSWSIVYPTSTIVTGNGCPTELTCNLTRNDTGLVSNPDSATLDIGNYSYVFNTSGNDNYTSNTTTNILYIYSSTNPPNITYTGSGLTLTYNQTKNTLGQSVFNKTFTSAGDKTFYVNLPKNATVTNAKMNLSGYNNSLYGYIDHTPPTGYYWRLGDEYHTRIGQNFSLGWNAIIYKLESFSEGGWGTDANVNYSIRSSSFDGTILAQNSSCSYGSSYNCSLDSNLSINNGTEYYWIIVNTTPTVYEYISMGITPHTYSYGFLSSYTGTGWADVPGYDLRFRIYYYNQTYTQNPSLSISNQIWNYSGSYSSNQQTNDFSTSLNSYLRSCNPYTDGTCDVPFTLHSDSAGIIQATLNATITYDTQIYDSSEDEGENSEFWIRVNASSDITNVVANLIYNGTSYDYDARSNIGSYWTFDKILTIPSASSDTNISFYWSFTYTNSTGSYIQNFTNSYQIVLVLGLSNCTSGAASLNFTGFFEENQSSTNFSMDVNISYGSSLGNLYKNFNHSFSGNNTYQICLSGTTIYANAVIRYWNDTALPRYYYLDAVILTNTTQNISLYMPNASYTRTTLTIVNSYSQLIDDAIIYVQRDYDGTYKTIVEGKTTGTGVFTFDLNPNILYNVIITSSQGTRTTTLQPISSSYTILLPSGGVDLPSYWEAFNGWTNTCVFDNTTPKWTCSWTDVSGHLMGVRMKVDTIGLSSTNICDNITTQTNGTFVCYLPNLNNVTYAMTLLSKHGSIDESWVQMGSAIKSFFITFKWGLIGIFITFVITMVFGFFSLQIGRPTFIIFSTLMSIIFCFFMGFIGPIESMGGAIIGLVFAGVIIMYKSGG